ncbi:hypothetical protein G9F70_011950 [Clostridium sp. FP1]|nr:hypothetical protein [Clostridium sp. FP1]
MPEKSGISIGYSVFPSDGVTFEEMNKGISKGKAIKILREKFNISKKILWFLEIIITI